MAPTVHTFDTEALPILVTLTDADIQPDVTVAPAGKVRFTVMNQGELPHDFLILPIEVAGGRADEAMFTLPATGPGDNTDVELELEPGTYVIASSDIHSPDARAELTVQPAETHGGTPHPQPLNGEETRRSA